MSQINLVLSSSASINVLGTTYGLDSFSDRPCSSREMTPRRSDSLETALGGSNSALVSASASYFADESLDGAEKGRDLEPGKMPEQ